MWRIYSNSDSHGGKLVKIMALEGQMRQMEKKCIFDVRKIFLYGPRFLR
jgi:hypothetical protein